MSKRTTGETHPFQALEEEAYHAFREWPVWLVLRERELDAHLAAQRPQHLADADQPSAKQRRHPALDEGGK